MGSNVIMKHARMAVLGAAILAAGCQEQTVPLRLSVVNDQIAPDHAEHFVAAGAGGDGCYVNPDFHPSDDESDNLFFALLSNTGDAIGRIFSPAVALTERGFQYFSGDRPRGRCR